MIIRAADLDPEGLELNLPLIIEPLSSDADEPIPVDDLFLSGRVYPRRGGIVLKGRLTGRLEIPCSRCLRVCGMSLDRPLDLLYASEPPEGKEIQVSEDDLDASFLDAGGTLDLRQVAAEQIYLELPMKPLCSPTCLGLCVRCRGDLNSGACSCKDVRSIS